MRRTTPLLLGALLLCCSVAAQTFTVTGTVINQANVDPLADVLIATLDNSASAKTGSDGQFALVLPKRPREVVVTIDGFDPQRVDVPEGQGETASIGTIFLVPDNIDDVIDLDRSYNQVGQDGEDFGSAATTSSLLTGSRNPFERAAAFNFNATRFRIRGYENRYFETFLNGAPVNDPEAGRAFFFLWGGLNDVTRNRYNTADLSFNPYDFAALAGVGNIDIRAGSQRAGSRLSFANSNRSWRYRAMATHNSGFNEKGFAWSASASYRWADEGYAPGTYQQAYAYFLAVDKQVGDAHRFSANIMGSPSLRGGNGSSIQEVYDLAGDNYFNPNWGFQNGEVRNAREYRQHQPILTLTHEWTPSASTNWMTTVVGMTGRNGQTRLERANAPNPLGTYYQYLPSYSLNSETREQVAAKIRANPNLLQIQWDDLYTINRAQDDVIQNANGIEGQSQTGANARYWMEEQRYDPDRLTLTSRFRHALTPQWTFHGGIIGQYSRVHNFKVLDDLLGADFVLDINAFAERDLGSLDAAQNNLDRPNGIIFEGDKFGWDYETHVLTQRAFTQVEYAGKLFDAFASIGFDREQQWRVGNVRNGQFPETSQGVGQRMFFNTGTVKGGLTYKINGRNYLSVRSQYGTKAPDVRDAFISPRTRDGFVEDLEVERIFSAEASYVFRAPRFKAQLTGYVTTFQDRTRLSRFFIETLDNNDGFGSLVQRGINSEHVGIEAAFEYDLTSSLEVTGMLAAGRYQFTDRPTFDAIIDNSGELIIDDEIYYLRNFFVSQTPQQAASLGLRYQGAQYYTISLAASYSRYAFVDTAPLRRTDNAVVGLDPDSDQFRSIIDQQELPEAFTVDLFATKSIKFGDKFLFLTVGVNNLLNDQTIISGAREQLRFDVEGRDPNRFPPQFYYAYGTNYFAQAAFQF